MNLQYAKRIDPGCCYRQLCAKLWLIVCNQHTTCGASPGIRLSTVINFNLIALDRHDASRKYLKMSNRISKRWDEDVKRSYCMNTEHLFIMCWASFLIWSYSLATTARRTNCWCTLRVWFWILMNKSTAKGDCVSMSVHFISWPCLWLEI